jgi:hypothetical protein
MHQPSEEFGPDACVNKPQKSYERYDEKKHSAEDGSPMPFRSLVRMTRSARRNLTRQEMNCECEGTNGQR